MLNEEQEGRKMKRYGLKFSAESFDKDTTAEKDQSACNRLLERLQAGSQR